MRHILIALMLTVAPAANAAEPICSTVRAVIDTLDEDFGETATAAGETYTGGAVVLFVNRETRTWTLVEVSAVDDTACIAAVGENMRFAPTGRPA